MLALLTFFVIGLALGYVFDRSPDVPDGDSSDPAGAFERPQGVVDAENARRAAAD